MMTATNQLQERNNRFFAGWDAYNKSLPVEQQLPHHDIDELHVFMDNLCKNADLTGLQDLLQGLLLLQRTPAMIAEHVQDMIYELEDQLEV